MISFSFPFILLLIPVIIGIWYYLFHEKVGYNHPNSLIAKYLINGNHIKILWFLRTLIVITILGLLAGTHFSYSRIVHEIKSQDIMIVFDISLSMLAEDMNPNRMEVAKGVIKNFITTRNKDQIGLVIFAGKPFVSAPFSNDYNGIKNIITGLSPYLIRQDLPGLSGTNIGDAITLAIMTHSGRLSPEKSIILLTDGKANIGINPIIAAKEAKEKNIKIYSIGIGTLSGGELSYTNTYGQKTYFYDEKGNKLNNDLDEGMMKNISNLSNGQYFHAENKSKLDSIFSEIDKKIPVLKEEIFKKLDINLTIPLLILLGFLLLLERVLLVMIIKKYQLE